MGKRRDEKNKAGIAAGKARAEKANQAAADLQKKGEQAGHGVKLTRAEVKAAKEKEKNA